jgi:hypothetical protein
LKSWISFRSRLSGSDAGADVVVKVFADALADEAVFTDAF